MRPITQFLLLSGPTIAGITSISVIIEEGEILDPLEAEIVDTTLEAELVDVVLEADIPEPLDAEIT